MIEFHIEAISAAYLEIFYPNFVQIILHGSLFLPFFFSMNKCTLSHFYPQKFTKYAFHRNLYFICAKY